MPGTVADRSGLRPSGSMKRTPSPRRLSPCPCRQEARRGGGRPPYRKQYLWRRALRGGHFARAHRPPRLVETAPRPHPPPCRPVSLRIRVAAFVLPILLAGCATAPPAPAPGREVTVLVYNIRAGKDLAGRDNLPRVAELVRSTRADLVLLQEVDRNTRRSGPADQP